MLPFVAPFASFSKPRLIEESPFTRARFGAIGVGPSSPSAFDRLERIGALFDGLAIVDVCLEVLAVTMVFILLAGDGWRVEVTETLIGRLLSEEAMAVSAKAFGGTDVSFSIELEGWWRDDDEGMGGRGWSNDEVDVCGTERGDGRALEPSSVSERARENERLRRAFAFDTNDLALPDRSLS